ncbi:MULTISPECIES: hypothetical protein [unclassified Synechococcus]|uniref:hypothetical protein n=1 Tax=unclassified Synechococcus TaxID=2626047 RepID=UPI00117D08BD|nr:MULTISPECIES: hypothetical protein [unclassified Synechococcus]MBD2720451.1 hypothetical protein [Synechococcus sp. FACHB-909]
MTDFATWWRRADRRLNGRLGIGVVAGLMLTGCGASPTVEAPPAPAPPPQAAPTPSSGAVPEGLTPLPTSQQVVSAFRMGRQDPFGSLVPELVPGAVTAAASAQAAATPPPFLKDFRVTGVINSGGQSEAVVTYRQLSGSLRPGDRGGRNTDLLPSGWSVASVDVANGSMILQSGSRRVKVEL